MRNIKLIIEYNGRNFNGWQKQPNKLNIQGELEKVIGEITGEEIDLIASGRTDAGVHALNQKAHFELDIKISPDRLLRGMNSLLPSDIYVKTLESVSENFHARFDAISKEYIYQRLANLF